MSKFRFTLQPVLDHRGRIEDERRQELAVAQHALNEAIALLSLLHEDFRVHSAMLREDHKAFDTEQLRLYYAHLEFLDRAITAQEKTVAERKADHEQARERLLEASKEKKALDKLKERRRDAHAAAQTILEQRELDDSNARRFSRALSGGSTP